MCQVTLADIPCDHTWNECIMPCTVTCAFSTITKRTAVCVASLQNWSCMSDTHMMLSPQHVHDTASAFVVITCVVLRFSSVLIQRSLLTHTFRSPTEATCVSTSQARLRHRARQTTSLALLLRSITGRASQQGYPRSWLELQAPSASAGLLCTRSVQSTSALHVTSVCSKH